MGHTRKFSKINLPRHDWPIFQPGWVWLCGAGPGDPGLLSLHGVNALQQADVVVYDALVSDEILDWAPQADFLYAGKRGGKPSISQGDITLKLIALAQQEKRVLRLKGGDPFVFGRGGEEAKELLARHIPIRVIPGITAGIGGLAYAGIPATHRGINQSVTFITGHDQNGQSPSQVNWQAVSDASETLVIYMGVKHLEEITSQLMRAGRPADEPVAVVVHATMKDQKILETTLKHAVRDVLDQKLTPPAIICVGQAVRMRDVLDWQTVCANVQHQQSDKLYNAFSRKYT